MEAVKKTMAIKDGYWYIEDKLELFPTWEGEKRISPGKFEPWTLRYRSDDPTWQSNYNIRCKVMTSEYFTKGYRQVDDSIYQSNQGGPLIDFNGDVPILRFSNGTSMECPTHNHYRQFRGLLVTIDS